MPTFVIPDAHGNAELVRGLLAQEGLEGGQPGVIIVQLGDLANCVAESVREDLESLDLVKQGLIDMMLVGNHEHPYFGGPAFSGYWPDSEVRRAIQNLASRDAIRAAWNAEGILLTHAGLHGQFLETLFGATTVSEIVEEINEAWYHDKRLPIFSQIGRARGGWSKNGGILWADWMESKARGVPQLFGHTVGKRIRTRQVVACIDLGAGKYGKRIAGAWIRSGEIETVIYTLPS